jgi:flavorubredoxin
MQIIFTAVGIYFFWLMLDEGTFVERLDNMAVLLFCLWRIHRQRDIICYVTEKGLIVRRQFMSFQEFYNEQVHEEKNLVFLPYKDIFSISDNWQEIQLGQAVEGGIAVLPVHLQFLSKKHKQHIIDRIEEAREEDDDE